MRTHFLAILSLLAFPVLAETQKSPLRYEIKAAVADTSLGKTETQLALTFLDENRSPFTAVVTFAADKQQCGVTPASDGRADVKVQAGKRNLYFYHDGFEEVIIYSIELKAQTRQEITVCFALAQLMQIVEKPVIYLYPQRETDVRLKLEPKGKMTFTYPSYDAGWNVSASPGGTIRANDKTYNYLFWEAEMKIAQQDVLPGDGFVVKKENLLSFLESSLEKIGLQSKEAQDFITYWYPRMQANENTYVRFLFNDDFSKYAPLEISPKPDQLIRVFMLWSPLESGNFPQVKEQQLSSFERKGFTVVEWGGTELSPDELREAQ